MVKSSHLVFWVLFFSSCGYNIVPKHVKQNFSYCFDGIDTGIDTLMNIEGYYNFINENHCKDCYIRVMFYKDGTYVSSSTYPDRDESMQLHFENTIKDKKALYWFHKYRDWGRYTLNSDTIKLQVINRPVWGSTSCAWWLYEIWYKIIDRNTIIGIPAKKTIRYPDDLEEKIYMRKFGIPAKFTPVPVRPSSDCWLKDEKWFWCNEEDWKTYKSRQNED